MPGARNCRVEKVALQLMTKRLNDRHHNHIIFQPLRLVNGAGIRQANSRCGLLERNRHRDVCVPENLEFEFLGLVVDAGDLAHVAVENPKPVIIADDHNPIILPYRVFPNVNLPKRGIRGVQEIPEQGIELRHPDLPGVTWTQDLEIRAAVE